jgi:hypothetical protein
VSISLALRYSSRVAILAAAALAPAALGSCGLPLSPQGRPLPIREIEELYQETRALRDEIDVTRAGGSTTTTAGVPLADVVQRYGAARAGLARALAAGAAPPLSEEDARALEVMRRTLARELVPEEVARASAGTANGAEGEVECRYDPELVANGSDGHEALSKRIYACFAEAAHSLSFEGDEMDRLTVFGLLALTDDPSRREALWLALAPVWQAVNGDNGPRSPYRTLVRRNSARLRDEGEPLGASVRGIGVEPALMEEWLSLVLQRWDEIAPDAPIEPWDFAYAAGRGDRALDARIPLESLRPINDRFYADLGADPAALQVRYDLEPRANKDPVAFTTFGRRPRAFAHAVIPGEPWVFASYRIGGLGNLLELLHETGHAVHIAAVRARPAFTDWPDSDVFTEAIADVASLEAYEPAWQRRYLGASVPIEAGIRGKYAGIVMDVAWALFEVRVHREPERDPNEVWTEITRSYLRIEPHPDRAWWAVRGQLVGEPGYMMNYAAGAILAADLRARLRELYGSYTEGDPGWYARAARSLYRFGLEKPSKDVIEEFLGRPVSPQALLDDMARAELGNLGDNLDNLGDVRESEVVDRGSRPRSVAGSSQLRSRGTSLECAPPARVGSGLGSAP